MLQTPNKLRGLSAPLRLISVFKARTVIKWFYFKMLTVMEIEHGFECSLSAVLAVLRERVILVPRLVHNTHFLGASAVGEGGCFQPGSMFMG